MASLTKLLSPKNSTNLFRSQVLARCQSNAHSPVVDECPSSSTKLIEPEEPIVYTSDIPGPKSKDLLTKLGQYQNTDAVHFFVDYARCRGNYVADADGNMLLDLFQQIASLPLGYNHPRLKKIIQNPENLTTLINRPALGSYPPIDFADNILKTLLSVAPPGLNQIQTMGCGTCSIESGMKAIHMAYQRRIRGPVPYSDQELTSCVMNQPPGSPKLSFISFKNAFHGRGMAALGMSHAQWFHKLDFPAPDWPIAEFPQLRYPLEEFVTENNKEEQRCLDQVRELISEWAKRKDPVAGICIEPIQSEGGDNHASPAFFQGLQQICEETGIYLMLDEVQTGGGVSGKFWAHEHFNLPRPPSVVTFSKKMLSGGFFFTDELRPKEGYRIYNTWVGDNMRLVILDQVLQEVKEKDLVNNAAFVGKYLLDGLKQIEREFPGLIFNARGLGTICAIDAPNTEKRNDIAKRMRLKGVHLGGSGKSTLRLRPSLIFECRHADIFFDKLRATLVDLNSNK